MVTLLNFLPLSLFLYLTTASQDLSWQSSLPKIIRKRDTQNSIINDPKCYQIKTTCSHIPEGDDIAVIECLQADMNRIIQVSEECQHVIWTRISELIKDENVKNWLMPICNVDIRNLPDCRASEDSSGAFLKCIVTYKDQISNKDCVELITRIENVAFYDYKWIEGFLQHCNRDIKNLNCGRLSMRDTQEETIVCLQNNFSNVSEECRSEVFKLSEIQADSIKLDRQLYMACAEDQMRYCRRFPPGNGKAFNCLLMHRNEHLSEKCREHLLRRQKLISHDYRVSKGLMKACKDEIKKYHCRRQTSEDKPIRLAQVLLCLEGLVRNGTKIDEACEAEMRDHRKMLMEDFRLSPEIVSGCSLEIKKFCTELEVGGKTIHCLMKVARIDNGRNIRLVCERTLESLIKQADVGEDWRVDPVLYEACNPVVQVACKGIHGGNARVLSCLMDNIGADHMVEECEEALMQIQYFVVRDFKLDPQLYKACRGDGVKFCNADDAWNEQTFNTDNSPLVLPCLYRYAYLEDKDKQLKATCLEQIHRVMRQRAISVALHPEIEKACIDDLARFCYQKTKKGEEMVCLQDNMDKLEDDCKDVIETYTEIEAENAELNPYIMANCREIMHNFCSFQMKHDEGDIMECLIAHKNNPIVRSNNKCRASIEHFQIISLKNYRFSYKFKIACKRPALRFCSNAKNKAAVVACLSEKVTNDTINGLKSEIPKECRQQIKSQLFQQRENIDFDSKLAVACENDIKLYCNDVEHGSGQVLECLQMTTSKLSDSCEMELFKIKKQELNDNSIDYSLRTQCAETIQQFCPNIESSHVLDCLRKHKDSTGFNKKCKSVVITRINEQNSDYRLNPSLQQNCKLDIKKFCADVFIHIKPDKELNGEMIKCLKNSFKKSRLSNTCEQEITNILREQASDLQLNPLLRAVCHNELDTICRIEEDDDFGNAEECLKAALLNKQIPTRTCQVEVANLIQESEADIQVDPKLQQACSVDLLKFCSNVQQGNGRHIKCLKVIMEDSSKQLTQECKNMLSKRLEMYRNAAELVPPENFQELYSQVVASPAKHYFFLFILTVIGSIFIFGIFCGRASRRMMLIKNK